MGMDWGTILATRIYKNTPETAFARAHQDRNDYRCNQNCKNPQFLWLIDIRFQSIQGECNGILLYCIVCNVLLFAQSLEATSSEIAIASIE